MNDDLLYMQRCIQLAELGAGYVAPNPMVGALLVFDGKIIGEGFHRQYGKAHAEVNCIADAAMKFKTKNEGGDDLFELLLQKCTLYVSLEPCAHYGKTPPCADLIIAKKIPHVVIGCLDPFNEVDGRGMAKLVAAGIKVSYGILEDSCKKLNKRFFTFHNRQRPYIILKWAQSANCKIAGQHMSRVYITNECTNLVVHKWRSEEAAILVGTNTAFHDNPSLTNRLWSGNNPVRLLVDMNLRLPLSLKLFDRTVKTVVFNSQREEDIGGLTYVKINGQNPLAQQIAEKLHQMNIQSVLVEGGTQLIQTFIDENLWDEARVITNEDLQITRGITAPELSENILENSGKIGSDRLKYYTSKFTDRE